MIFWKAVKMRKWAGTCMKEAVLERHSFIARPLGYPKWERSIRTKVEPLSSFSNERTYCKLRWGIEEEILDENVYWMTRRTDRGENLLSKAGRQSAERPEHDNEQRKNKTIVKMLKMYIKEQLEMWIIQANIFVGLTKKIWVLNCINTILRWDVDIRNLIEC